MGGASSKVTRKLPTKPSPSWAGAQTLPAEATREVPRAGETKYEAIEKDSRDPQFMANLSRLGPVKVDHHMTAVRPNTLAEKMHNSRNVSEQQASSAGRTRNRMLAGSLLALLDERKFVTSCHELEKLAERYDIDVNVLERLAKSFNSPSIGENTAQKIVSDDGQEKVTMLAVWSEPSITVDPNNRISSGQKQ